MSDSLSMVEFGLGHSGMKRKSFSDDGPGKLWSGKLFIGECMEDFSTMKGSFIVILEYSSEKKTEHDGLLVKK